MSRTRLEAKPELLPDQTRSQLALMVHQLERWVSRANLRALQLPACVRQTWLETLVFAGLGL